jgi:hypothetical protein
MQDGCMSSSDEMREFMLIVRRALLMIVAYIERRYGIESRLIE